MKLPQNWAQDFAKFSAEPRQFADAMTMSGSKVETFDSEAYHMKNVVIGRIESLARHPDSDHLWICQVNIGQAEPVQIVTGAQNLKEGDLCPVALHNSKLPNGAEIKRGKLRGVVSNGMLCSLDELGLTTHDFPHAVEDGILVLDTPAPLGQSAAEALGMDDITFEFEITPNRPDCLSVLGLAREAAATFKVPFEAPRPAMPIGSGDIRQLLSARVVATDICNRYSVAMVDNVRIKESPQWLRQRLRNAGVRPINNIVDITNYVMLEYGQPMHAFDYAYVNGGAIAVRMAKAGEKIVTLDNVERTLDEGMMVIADEKGPIAVAGVMGGEYSGVYETTRRVVFESACFDGPSVRATSKKLNLRTESSSRFEKGLDPETAGPALCRALELVVELDAGDVMEGVLDEYPAPRTVRRIPFEPDGVNRLLGIEVSRADMEAILRPLDFGIEGNTIVVPTARYDVARTSDIAEEIARFVGYNKIPSTGLRGTVSARASARQTFDEALCDTLVGYGFWQCETFSFYSPKGFDMIRLPQNDALRNAIQILHPLGEDTSIMRTTALPSMLEVVARNWASRNESAALFEQATEYIPTGDENTLPTERQKLVLAAYGEEWDYAAMKGALEGLLNSVGVKRIEVVRNSAGTSFHPGRCADIYLILKGKKGTQDKERGLHLATLGEVHPLVLQNYGIKPRVVMADINLDVLFAARGGIPQYKRLPRFPAITRDLALVAAEDVPAAEIAKRVQNAAGNKLEKLALFDVYTGERLPAGKKSLAYNLVLRDENATLTDEDADAAVGRILESLAEIEVVLRT